MVSKVHTPDCNECAAPIQRIGMHAPFGARHSNFGGLFLLVSPYVCREYL